MDFCCLFVSCLFEVLCAYPIHLSYILHIRPSTPSFSLDSLFSLSLFSYTPPPPAMMTEHGNRYFRNLHLTQQTSLPSFQYIHHPQTPLSISSLRPPCTQNSERPISLSVSRPLSFIHRATAVLGRRVAHAERKRARRGGMKCSLGCWYREGIWKAWLEVWMV